MAKADAKILVVDVGGNKVKMMHAGSDERRKFKSGNKLTASEMCVKVLETTDDWNYDRVVIGCPGPVENNTLAIEPVNLGPGWSGFDFSKAFSRPVTVINDAVMQAIGSHDGGKMLFLGLGTGLGAALVTEREAFPLEVAHLPYKDGFTFEDCVGRRGLDRSGEKQWLADVFDVIALLKSALLADCVVIGGGNAKRLPEKLPPNIALGDNKNAFIGGFKLGAAMTA